MITSRQNPLIKEYRQYRHKSLPGENRILVEGVRLVEEAWKSGALFEALFFTPEMLKKDRAGRLLNTIEPRARVFHQVSVEVLESLSHDETPSGIFAVVRIPPKPFVPGRLGVAVLCGVQDPGNAGSLLRCAEGSGFSVFFSEESVRPASPKVVKASMGAFFRVPLKRGAVIPFLEEIRDQGFQVVGTRAREGIPYNQADWRAPMAILLGGEAVGLPEALHPYVSQYVSIPLEGDGESLNVAAAGAVLLFEAKRQQGNQGGAEKK